MKITLFVASQQRLKIGSEYYYPDLVFYNSKNKISRATEGQVIKNISIDGKINEYKK